MPSTARTAAREAEANPAFRLAARAGYAANGALHLLIGALVIAVGLGATEDSDQTGAFRALAAVPLGAVALWALAVGLVTLGAWHLLQAFAPRHLTVWRRLARIAAEAPQGWCSSSSVSSRHPSPSAPVPEPNRPPRTSAAAS